MTPFDTIIQIQIGFKMFIINLQLLCRHALETKILVFKSFEIGTNKQNYCFSYDKELHRDYVTMFRHQS